MDSKDEKHLQENVRDSYEQPVRKGGIMNKLYPPGPKSGAGGRMKNHCRKFWWCDLLVLIVVVLVIVLPIIYVAIPNKAQKDINKSTIEVLEQILEDPQPDGFHLKLVSLAKSSSKFHPTIRAFEADLSLEGQEPFLTIPVPQAKANKEFEIEIEEDIKLPSLERFTDYTKTVMGSETFKVYMDGKTKIKLSGLSAISVDYNKVITMKGLNHLKGLNITETHLLKKPLEDGSNMDGKVFIPNPSVMTLVLGNVTMNLKVDDTPIGTCLLPDLTIKPGDNSVYMQAKVETSAVIRLITSKYKNAILPLTITGNTSMVGDKHLTYYEAAIRANVVKVDLNVAPALESLGLNISSF